MECTLIGCDLQEDNYVLTIRRNDGSIVNILVPREDTSDEYVRRCMEDPMVVGLNLVSHGHYT